MDRIAAELRGEGWDRNRGQAAHVNPTLGELEAMIAVIEHATYAEAAAALGTSAHTISSQISSVIGRIGASNRTHAAWLLWPVIRDAFEDHGDRRTGYQRRRA